MKFYVLDRNFSEKFATGSVGPKAQYSDPPYCQKCGGPMSMMIWRPPFTIELDSPKFGDFVYGGGFDFIVSEQFKSAYEQSDLTGIDEFFPVNITRIKGNSKNSTPPHYYTFHIKLDDTEVDFVKSRIVFDEDDKNTCDACTNGEIIDMAGIHIAEESWTGLDIFFMKKLYGYIIVTQRFYDFVHEHKFTNVDLIEAEKYIPPWITLFKGEEE